MDFSGTSAVRTAVTTLGWLVAAALAAPPLRICMTIRICCCCGLSGCAPSVGSLTFTASAEVPAAVSFSRADLMSAASLSTASRALLPSLRSCTVTRTISGRAVMVAVPVAETCRADACCCAGAAVAAMKIIATAAVAAGTVMRFMCGLPNAGIATATGPS